MRVSRTQIFILPTCKFSNQDSLMVHMLCSLHSTQDKSSSCQVHSHSRPQRCSIVNLLFTGGPILTLQPLNFNLCKMNERIKCVLSTWRLLNWIHYQRPKTTSQTYLTLIVLPSRMDRMASWSLSRPRSSGNLWADITLPFLSSRVASFPGNVSAGWATIQGTTFFDQVMRANALPR